MALSSREELLDDSTKLEPKVVLALSRLSKGRDNGRKSGKSVGVAVKHIIEYLSANYCNLDGDIESQVKTALFSCVKSGTVCALDNGKFLLLGPGSKGMISKCIARTSHGTKCSCWSTIKRFSKTFPKACCHVKAYPSSVNRTRKKLRKGKPGIKNAKKQPITKVKPRRVCVQEAQQMLEKRKSCGIMFADLADSKCNYCSEFHGPEENSTLNLCETCHPLGISFVAPYDKFSPREELM